MNMNMMEAVASVRADVRPGIRGTGCAAILMADGRRYVLDADRPFGPPQVMRFSAAGELLEYAPAVDVVGEVERILWGVDELGGIVTRPA